MRAHPYLRAYMAGITFPTLFLLVVLSVLIAVRRFGEVPVQAERFAVFPMAVVPNAWGLWNVVRLAIPPATRLPLGWHGALLAVVLPFLGYAVARAVGLHLPSPLGAVAVAWLVGIIVYYVVWKHLVAFLNELLGIHE